MIDNKKKALIHIAKAKTGMTEDEYRGMLAGFGVTSSKDLTNKTFVKVLKRFENMGFRSSNTKKHKPMSSKTRLISKIHAILNDLDLPENYANGMSKKMFKIEMFKWCTPQQLHKITAALAYHQTKHNAKKRAQI